MTDKTALGRYVQLKKQGFDRCLHSAFECNTPVKAHSIQNKKVLELLQKDDHVIVPQQPKDPLVLRVASRRSLSVLG
jgi:hypothetical protein